MTEKKQRVLLSWSSGKDSAWCLERIRGSDGFEVAGLLTTFRQSDHRVPMHGVPRSLVERQADVLGLPLVAVMLPWPCPNDRYVSTMTDALRGAQADLGFDSVAFGDLFLEDVRAWREEQFGRLGIELVFPLWREPTDKLAGEMVSSGLEAVVTCVDLAQCPAEFAGRRFDRKFLDDLPASVDPCGERGEFHTFVCDGPMFSQPIEVSVGDVRTVDGFVIADIESANPSAVRH